MAIGFLGRRIPLPLGRGLGSALGCLGWYVARRDRRKALHNIALAFPDWDPSRHRQVIREMFRHLGISLFEIAWMPNLNSGNVDRYTSFEGLDRILDLVREGRAVVAFTGHCGNWEWIAYACALRARVSVLQRERSDEGMNAFITDIRNQAGIQTIDRGSPSAARELIQALRTPGVLAFLIDQSIRAESVKIEFFGRPALTPIGPAKLAIRGAVPVAAGFVHRDDQGRHHIQFEEPITTSREDDPVALTTHLTRAIENQVRAHPEQWVWMHDRWRDRPSWDVTSDRTAEESPDHRK